MEVHVENLCSGPSLAFRLQDSSLSVSAKSENLHHIRKRLRMKKIFQMSSMLLSIRQQQILSIRSDLLASEQTCTLAPVAPEALSSSSPSDMEVHVENLCSGPSLAFRLQDSYLSASAKSENLHHIRKRLRMKKIFQMSSMLLSIRQQQILSIRSDLLASEQTCTLAPVAPEALSSSSPSGSLIRGSIWQTT
ncbi:unnamed protein product [Pleuronectes platessa]|uniref:Uncharacterized protein n=1 Tax=Pleuronectes platessa TaxID=8262 RepID=A0A9N7YJS8_PLEPL|nr:unnamed protein product [Pleuronectes platessa]